ncbi:DUF262 domain-containing protein [Shewanella carassii]|uniref:GmrSD restriction endonucleases N-terminal domain-containing protein n=1 Tax=Shewanella carassii TaxID=1987584 RepID=A0ABQ1T3B8_9GAMM|nr:DUF262 domain-containing protein [Shewanella carassii]GGE77287.1 hypothetical protein GCM10011520_17220 [Shewanella carassii]
MKDNLSEFKEELSESGERIGIEAEEDNETIEPFDPEEISIQQKIVSMDVIVRRLNQGSIILSPSFQRKEVWDRTRRSRLIESLMLNIPLPMFYVAADENGDWEVVDGLQRLSAIRDFLIGNKDGMPLQLTNLEFLGERYGNKTWKVIESDKDSQKLVNSIYETELRFTVINPGTPDAVKRNIFKRINTGGMPLTSQEIRHALYEGSSSNLLRRLVDSQEFVRAMGKKIDDSRMGASELVLRLISFMIFDRSSYSHSMDSWLSNAMRVMNLFPNIESEDVDKIFGDAKAPAITVGTLEEVEARFFLAMSRGYEIFGGHAFRKSLPSSDRKSPINKSLFEVWGNILSDLSDNEYNKLKKNKCNMLKEYGSILYDNEFSNAISRFSSTSKGISESHSTIFGLVNNHI